MLDPNIFEVLGINPEILANRSPATIRTYLLSYRRTFAITFHPDVCHDEDATAMLQTVNPFFDDVKHATPEALERLVRDAVDQKESGEEYEGLYLGAISEVVQLRSEVVQLMSEANQLRYEAGQSKSEAEKLRSEVRQLKSKQSGRYGELRATAVLLNAKEKLQALALGVPA